MLGFFFFKTDFFFITKPKCCSISPLKTRAKMLHIDFMSLTNWGRGFALKDSSICPTQGCYSCVGGLQKCLAYDMGTERADTVSFLQPFERECRACWFNCSSAFGYMTYIQEKGRLWDTGHTFCSLHTLEIVKKPRTFMGPFTWEGLIQPIIILLNSGQLKLGE